MNASPRTAEASLAEIEAVYRLEALRFVRVATAILGDEDDGWEAVQDAVASAVRTRRAFRGEGTISAWMWTAVVNTARSRLRQRRPTIAMDVEIDVPTTHARRGPQELVRGAVAALPERQRLMIFLRYYAELSYEEIAAVVGVRTGTVGPTLSAALARLRNLLDEGER